MQRLQNRIDIGNSRQLWFLPSAEGELNASTAEKVRKQCKDGREAE